MALTITHTTPADGTFSATGAAAWNATHSLTVTGTSGQLQYNNGGDLAGMSGTSWNDTTRSLTLTGATVTASAPVFDVSQTWNNAAVTFTGLRFNAAGTSGTNSAAASLLMDLQTGGTSRFTVRKDGWVSAPLIGLDYSLTSAIFFSGANTIFYISSGEAARLTSASFSLPSSNRLDWNSDLILTRRGAANLRLGAADAAAPVAQTLSVQSVSSGTSNTAGANLTITGSQGTGTGAGGSIIFQVAPAGSSGTAQNALVNALIITQQSTGNSEVRVVNAGGGSGNLLVATTANNNSTVQIKHSTLVDGSSGSTVAYLGRISSNLGVFDGGGTMIVGAPANSTDSISIWGTDVRLARDAANTLALRNGTNAQAFNIYNTFTSDTNFERFRIFAQSAGSVIIGTQKGSGGGTARGLELQTDGTTRLSFSADSSLAIISSTNLITGTQIRINNATRLTNSADGVLQISDSSQANFGRLQFGGTTSSFPALKRVSANIQVVAADDAGSAGFIVGNQALATTATDGFLYVPTCAGTPTGTPTTQTGTAPIVVDTTNNKLYFYSGGAWRDAGP